ncbi:MAG: hypothetical protein ACRCX2_27745 [Paraclostridium sp.]
MNKTGAGYNSRIRKYYNNNQDFILFIKVTEDCNMFCSFCYQEGMKRDYYMSAEHMPKVCKNIDFVIKRFMSIKNINVDSKSKLAIVFFGGEPTLNMPAIHSILNHIEYTYTEGFVKRNIDLCLTTNGTNLDDTFTRFVSRCIRINGRQPGIMVSCDTNAISFEKNRAVGDETPDIINDILSYKEKYKKDTGLELNLLVTSVVADITDINLYDPAKFLKNKIRTAYKELYTDEKFDIEDREAYEKRLISFHVEQFKTVAEMDSSKDTKLRHLFKMWLTSGGLNHTYECTSLTSMRYNGDFTPCNNNIIFDGVMDTQEEIMRRLFNTYAHPQDNTHPCPKVKRTFSEENYKDTSNINGEIIPRLFKEYFVDNYPTLPLYSEIDHPNISVLFRYGFDESAIRIFHPEAGAYYINHDGDIFIDHRLKDYPECVVSNIHEEYFLYFDLPAMLKSLTYLTNVEDLI